jgi:hypothetical protein
MTFGWRLALLTDRNHPTQRVYIKVSAFEPISSPAEPPGNTRIVMLGLSGANGSVEVETTEALRPNLGPKWGHPATPIMARRPVLKLEHRTGIPA